MTCMSYCTKVALQGGSRFELVKKQRRIGGRESQLLALAVWRDAFSFPCLLDAPRVARLVVGTPRVPGPSRGLVLDMLRQEDMQSARKDAVQLEHALNAALEDYLRFDYASHIAADSGDIEAGGGKLQQLESNVANLLEKCQTHVEKMEAMGSANSQSVAWKAQIARLRTVLQSSQADFKRTREAIRQRQESAMLLRAARERTGMASSEDDVTQRLYEQESRGIHSSIQRIDENIELAVNVKAAIENQRERIKRATGQLMNMIDSIPGINNIISAASRKKLRDNMIVATAIAFFICLTLFWMFTA